MKNLNFKKFIIILSILTIALFVLFPSNNVKADNSNIFIGMITQEKSYGYGPISEKHKEIDKYVFKDHDEELNDMGIQITYTVQMEDYVEIGIIPYTRRNVDYINSIFGADYVKVVKGEDVALMSEPLITPTEPQGSESVNFSLPLELYIIPASLLIGIIIFVIYNKKSSDKNF